MGSALYMVMKNFDAYIFDLDGTLANTRTDLAEGVNYALVQCGFAPLSREEVISYVGDGLSRLLERVLKENAAEWTERIRFHFDVHYREHLADHSELYPQTVAMLEAHNGKKLAVLSNKPHQYTVPLVEKLGIAPYFEVILGAGDAVPHKPDPAGLLQILEKLAVPPHRALMMGDSPNDVLVGQAVGAATGAITFGFRAAAELTALHPDFVLDSWDSFLE